LTAFDKNDILGGKQITVTTRYSVRSLPMATVSGCEQVEAFGARGLE
jgi:hypothetical protein